MRLSQQTQNKGLVSQAERLLAVFGGAPRLAAVANLLGHPIDVSAIYRWTHSKAVRGCNGRVPAGNWDWIFECAEAVGVEITPELFDPRALPASPDPSSEVNQDQISDEERELLA